MDPGLRRDDEDEGGGLVFVGTIVATEVAPTRTRRPCGSWWERRSSRPRQGCEGTFDESPPLLSSSRRRPGSSGDVIGYCESQRAFALSRKPETGATRSFRDDEDEGGGLVFVGTIVATEVASTRIRRPCGSWWERRSSRPRQGCEGTFDESHPLLSSSRRRPGSRDYVVD